MDSAGQNLHSSHVFESRPALLDRFELIRTLGEGAAAAVYLVRDHERDGELVALKVLVNNAAFDEHTRERFRRELEVSKQIDHPNIVRAFEFLALPDQSIAFTMEWVDGANLGEIFRERKLSYDEIEDIFAQFLTGLEELHARGVIHRDLKLENILIANDGRVKISDLGLMKRLNSEGLTRTGVLLGTAQYLPPEYVLKAQFDERGDIYASGSILFELLTGKRRLADKPGMQAVEHLIKTKFEVPKLPLVGVPRKYVDIAYRALERSPRRRFQTAAEMREAMLSPAASWVLGGSGELTPRVPVRACPAPKPRPVARRMLLPLASVCMLLVCLFAGGFVAYRGMRQFELLDMGRYEGYAEVAGERSSFSLRVDQRGVYLTTDVPWCSAGYISRITSRVDCPANADFRIDSVIGDLYSGILRDRESGEVVIWRVKRKSITSTERLSRSRLESKSGGLDPHEIRLVSNFGNNAAEI